VTFENVEIVGKPIAVSAGGSTVTEISNSVLRGGTAIDVGGSANVTLRKTRLSGRKAVGKSATLKIKKK
jgi:hypothetical protein